jgi:transposase
MAKKTQKEIAYVLYMQTSKSQKEIAQQVGVSERTLSKWAREGEWELRKAAKEVTREEQIRNYLMQLKELNEEIQTRDTGKRYASPSESDTIKKITSAIRDLQKNVTLSDYIAVCEELLKYMLIKDQDLAKALADSVNEFVTAKAAELQK